MDVLIINQIRKNVWNSDKKNETFTSTLKPVSSFVLNPNPFSLIPGLTDEHMNLISTIIALIISCCSAYLAWSCDKKMPLGQRISTTWSTYLNNNTGIFTWNVLFNLFYRFYYITLRYIIDKNHNVSFVFRYWFFLRMLNFS